MATITIKPVANGYIVQYENYEANEQFAPRNRETFKEYIAVDLEGSLQIIRNLTEQGVLA